MLELIIIGGTFLFLLGLIYLLSFAPPNTICPQCKKRKQLKEHRWRRPCFRCEGREN